MSQGFYIQKNWLSSIKCQINYNQHAIIQGILYSIESELQTIKMTEGHWHKDYCWTLSIGYVIICRTKIKWELKGRVWCVTFICLGGIDILRLLKNEGERGEHNAKKKNQIILSK